LQPLQGTPIYESLQSALQKIGATLPPQSFKFLRDLDNALSVQGLGSKDYTRSKEAIKVLTHSVFHKFTTLIKHKTVRFERGIEREVDPYLFWYVNNGMYLVAHDHRSHELRLFAVERITAAKATNRRFEIPDEFNFEEFTKSAFNLIWGEPQEIKIRFSKEQAPYIRERTWHSTQMIKESDDGSIEFTMSVADLWEVKRWLIGFGADAEVMEPEQLRKDIERECDRNVQRRKDRPVDS
jgi:predicted DNA-binding transcriptional regulator YafY